MRNVKRLLAAFSIIILTTIPAKLSDAAQFQTDTPVYGSYEGYIQAYGDADTAVSEIVARPSDEGVLDECESARLTNPGEYGSDISAVSVDEGGFFDMNVRIGQAGLYRLNLDYYPMEGRWQDIKLSVMVDGTLPFKEAGRITLPRIWKDDGEIESDSGGNDLFPSQVEAPEWSDVDLRDSDGFYKDPFLFYLSEGDHTLRFTSLEEPVAVRTVTLAPQREIPSYEEALAAWHAAGYQEVGDYLYKKQAEQPDKKSSSALSAVSDRSDPAIEPSDGMKVKLNSLGGGRFDTNGMWVEYTVEAPQDGLYRLVIKAKQSGMKDQAAYRNIYVNGEIPFLEARDFPFPYSGSYKNVVLGTDDGACLVKLNKGENTIRLEASLGETAVYCRRLKECLDVLNAAYRKLVTLTGTTPDANRDYSLDKKMPDVIETFGQQYETLSAISQEIKEKGGQSTSYTSPIDALAIQLRRMHKNHYEIPANVASFRTNLSNLGNSVEGMVRTDLSLDYICVAGTQNTLPAPTAGFLRKTTWSVKNFVSSFFYDYSMVGTADNQKETIEVWMLGGRDQAQVLKQIIDSQFTAKTGIGVRVKLVSTAAALQRAIVAGEGPDVAIGLSQADAMNFAFRGATQDLTKFDDFDEISQRFPKSTVDILKYRDGVMGLPQTMSFCVLYYRKDLLGELGLDPPETWDDLYEMLPVLSQNNMSVGLPRMDTLKIMLYQRGGKYYDDDLSSSTLSDNLTIDTVTDWSEFYISRGLLTEYNFVNRFAAGDMPIAVESYGTYATLELYAPELSDSWSWTVVPGTRQEDGSVDHSTPIAVSASVIMKDTQKTDASWQFLKWWTSDETQADFGRFIENLLGTAGRYGTANLKAMSQMPWTGSLYEGLKDQVVQTVAIPEIPGGYYTDRYLDYGFWTLYDDNRKSGFEVRKIMYEYDMVVDNEIAYQKEALARAEEHEGEKR